MQVSAAISTRASTLAEADSDALCRWGNWGGWNNGYNNGWNNGWGGSSSNSAFHP